MSFLAVAIPDLIGIAKDLFSDQCVVAITPVPGNSGWADKAAWSIASAAASTGRRTALIDLDLDDPRLHNHAAHPKDTGIVDAFLFGASLQHVASKEEDPNLHFIGVGTPPLEPEEIWASDRWQRLFRGFKQEEAILLLFLPPVALETLALAPDLILAVTPHGFDSGGPRTPQLRSAVDRGVPLAVISAGPDYAPESQPEENESDSVDTEADSEVANQRSGFPRRGILIVLGIVVIAVVAVLVFMQRNRGATDGPIEPAANDPIPAAVADSAPQSSEPLPEDETTPRIGSDSGLAQQNSVGSFDQQIPAMEAGPLPYSIQVAAWSRLSQAHDHLVQFHVAGIAATITAVRRDSTRLWYRVFVGAASDFNAATELRQRLRADGLIESDGGVVLNTPQAMLLETHPDTVSGREAVRGLRESGIPAYIVSMSDGSVQVLVGAFESPDQAELIDFVFPEASRSLSRTLVSRVGIAR